MSTTTTTDATAIDQVLAKVRQGAKLSDACKLVAHRHSMSWDLLMSAVIASRQAAQTLTLGDLK